MVADLYVELNCYKKQLNGSKRDTKNAGKAPIGLVDLFMLYIK